MSPRTWWDRVRERFDTLSPRDRRAVVIGMVVLVPALIWAGVIQPYLGVLEDLHDRLAAEQALLSKEQGVVRAAPDLPARIETLRHEIDRLEMRLVRADNPALAEAALSAHLESLARLNRVLLQEVRSITGSPLGTASDGTVPVYLSVTGESDFEGVLGFLQEMEQARLLMKIDEVSIGTGSAAGEAGENGRAGAQTSVMRFTAIVVAFMREREAL